MRAWQGAAVVVLLPLLIVAGLLGVAFKHDYDAQRQAANPCTAPGAAAGPPGGGATSAGAGSVAGYSGVQLVNAAAIINAGVPLGVSRFGQQVAVMTAMGESALRVLDVGDAVGPDSRGLFQQRATGWGSYADRMDPARSAQSFYRALLAVPGWSGMAPTAAAHAVQRNADPFFYTRFWPAAVAVVAALTTGAPAASPPPVAGVAQLAAWNPGSVPCQPTPPPAPPVLGVGAWIRPAVGTLSSGFSPARVNPVTGVTEAHLGQDIANACGTPIVAAKAGTVISSGPASGFGNWIRIDHGGGVVTVYGHMRAVDLLVHVGDPVAAGQLISRIGSEGQSTGCHLHFQLEIGGRAVDPLPYLRNQGVAL